jgi:hypothetical protein
VLEAVDHVRSLAGIYNVRELVYDPWRFGQAAQELEREGMTCVAFPQHDARMIPASARLHAAIVEQRITLPDGHELAHHASDAVARHSRRGWRIDKPNPRANIDAVIALAMAVERAEQVPEPVELLGWLCSPASAAAGPPLRAGAPPADAPARTRTRRGGAYPAKSSPEMAPACSAGAPDRICRRITSIPAVRAGQMPPRTSSRSALRATRRSR